MRNLLYTLILILTLPIIVCAQAHHTDLKWGASTDAGVTYNVYKAIGVCPVTGLPASPTKVATGLSVLTYSDTAVLVGQVACYYVTAQLNGTESGPSNTAEGRTPVGKPGPLVITTVAVNRMQLGIHAY